MPQCLLYKWQPGWGLASISPACLEVEAYMRFASIDFAIENCTYTHTSPTGQQPALDVSGELISSDNEDKAARLIIDHLKGNVKDIDANLSQSDRADLTAYRTLVQTILEPASLCTMWLEADSYSTYTQARYGQGLPFPLCFILPRIQQFHVRQSLAHTTPEQIYESLEPAYAALAERLNGSDGDYIFGANPSSLDALLFGHLAFHEAAPVSCPEIQHQLRQHPVLKEYVDRISKDIFEKPVPFGASIMSQEWSQRAQAAARGASGRAEKQQHAQAEEDLDRNGKIWLGAAAAAVVAFCLFSGQYITIAGGYEFEDEDDTDDM
ncbi:hypothetical protein ABBQ32_004451 [Trebouxia sp. C0010 RCD-2024]